MRYQLIFIILVSLMDLTIPQSVYSRKVRNLRKRSIISLGQMINKLTGRSPVQFINYGYWCGLGGEGTPVDDIDQCCFKHDKCYDNAIAGPCQKLKEHPVFVRYSWTYNETETVQCDPSEDECIDTVCGCDVIIATCFKSNIDSFNPKHRTKKIVPGLYKLKLNQTET